MLTIAIVSLKEALRNKIVLFVSIATVLYLAVYTFLIFMVLENTKSTSDPVSLMSLFSMMLSILGFYASSMLSAFLAVMISIGAVSIEIENGTVHSMITKSIKRSHYVLGKFIGISIMAITYSTILFFSVLMIPILLGVKQTTFLSPGNVILGLCLFIFEPLVIIALSLFGSVSFKTLNNGIMVIGIYLLGFIGGIIEQLNAVLKIENLNTFAIIASLISPFDTIYRKMGDVVFSSLGGQVSIFSGPMMIAPAAPSTAMMIYIIAYFVILMFFAVRRFEKRDL